LDWLLGALADAGLDHTVFIGGYQIEMIQRDYPNLTYCHNENWSHNNILASLFYAEEYMTDGFVCSYADILYRGNVVRRALEHPGDIVLCVDTDWRTRYADRSLHPEGDAEKVIAEGDRVLRVHREIPSDQAEGEYIGVAKFSDVGAKWLREHYARVKTAFGGNVWQDGTVFEKAYLIHLFQAMIEDGVAFYMVTTDGEYMEIDTEEDYALANATWPEISEK
jgi:choline kinase